MTPIRDRFYFRLETERWTPLVSCVVYYRRENKRWWQREYVRFSDRLWWEWQTETPEEFAARVLDEQMESNAQMQRRSDLLAEYRELKPVRIVAD